MEYQSFFMILKQFQIKDNQFLSDQPLSAKGFVQIKKEQNQHSLVIQIANFKQKAKAYIVCGKKLICTFVCTATTKLYLPCMVEENIVVIVEDYNFFACKNGTNGCMEAYLKIQKNKQTKQEKSTMQKIFGVVHDTYFFDCIKPKLERLFQLGKPHEKLCSVFPKSRWTTVDVCGTEKVFGVIYKDKFAYAVAVGSQQNSQIEECKKYEIDGKIYNILFLSAANGKIIRF